MSRFSRVDACHFHCTKYTYFPTWLLSPLIRQPRICRLFVGPMFVKSRAFLSLASSAILICSTFLLACQTPYQPMGYRGGYQEVEIRPDIYQLEVRGNSHTTLTTISGYWHQRAREICSAKSKVPQVLEVKSGSKPARVVDGNIQ